ncbi:hypothetical protein [Dictyobacter kobayashii]|uniref:Uncharacterized protein n=1 Tax=Dictyobacter kobayashii TaxID=2014872 RepID=A0A402ADF5_9CHLR|nr:hypothetical protein [Dictyobacter kobayashii]GCE17123.1 hypothetical protein KDK_09230 [Dictyobacter kobayashii]
MNVPLSAELKPYIADFQVAWDQISIQPSNVGQYAVGVYPNLSLLSPAGNIAGAQELAQKAESDWAAALQKK